MELVTETAGPLTRLRRHPTMRRLIAIAIFLTALVTFYATSKDFINGFQEGRKFAVLCPK